MECQILTGHWFRCDRTLAQSSVSSFDQGEIFWHDRTLRGEQPDVGCQRPVDSSKVPERENRDRTRPVNADRMLSSVRSQLKHWILGRTDQSVWST